MVTSVPSWVPAPISADARDPLGSPPPLMIINLRFPINCHSRTGLIADPPTPLTTTDHSPHMSPTSPSHPLLLNPPSLEPLSPPVSHLSAYQYALPDAADASSFPSSLRVSPAQLLQLAPTFHHL